MNKLLTILLAGTFAAGAAVAQTSPATGANAGELAGSNTPSGTGSATGGTTGPTTADKRAARSGASSMGSAGTAGATGTLGASGDTGLCPPDMDKKDNSHCMPGSQVGKSAKPMARDKAMKSDKAEGEPAQDKTNIR